MSSWRLFAAAGGATLAMAGSAEADIMYTHPATPVEVGGQSKGFVSQGFTIDGPHKVDFAVRAYDSPGLRLQQVFATPGASLTLLYVFSGGLKAFALGSPISGARYHFGHSILRARTQETRGGAVFFNDSLGYFPIDRTAFVGFATPGNDFGWIRVEVLDRNSDGFPDALDVIDWAYNSTPFAPIDAGQMPTVPDPNSLSLALLATGACGLIAWRKRRKAGGRAH